MGRRSRKAGDDEGNEPKRTRNVVGAQFEENTLAILDGHESGRQQSQYTHDDSIAFLEAVRNAAVVAKNAHPPTDKMLDAVFEILKTGMSMESMTLSYQLLCELETRFPRVSFSVGKAPHSSPACGMECESEPLKGAWSPFSLSSDSITRERATFSDGSSASFDPIRFHALIQELAEMVNAANHSTLDLKSLRNLLVSHYLAKVLQEDFASPKDFPKEPKDWIAIRESLLNMILSSRKMNYKDFIKDCLSLVSGMGQFLAGLGTDDGSLRSSTMNSSKDCCNIIVIPLLEVGENVSLAIQKLLIMMMELDSLRKYADMQGFTTRADAVRTPTADIMLDELIYNDDILSPFLQAFDQQQWKLSIILQYFAKYMLKPTVRTRKGSDSSNHYTFNGVLKSLSEPSSLKGITKKIGSNTIQLLLAHAFKSHLSLANNPDLHGVSADSTEDQKGSSLIEVCCKMISAFECLKNTENLEIIPVGKEALFVASAILDASQ
ncbi:hypothetical protein MLD38_021169 [Melastoma candidum]|uniref:Uncharacterized protein n=1 Tax=Melastoma candidum TaxID=119954 RepID=A0ACB9QFB4_9MYRT|nr:hypothetical protein MLD38_021169 [Melastoma candidum]